MSNNYGLHVRTFNDRVSAMTQTKNSTLVLSANEARSLQSDIFSLLAHVAELSQQLNEKSDVVVDIQMDGGSFK